MKRCDIVGLTLLAIVLGALAWVVSVHAQTVRIVATRGGPVVIGWDQANAVADAAGFAFTIAIDGAPRVPIVQTCVSVTATTATCTGPLPATAPGTHTLILWANEHAGVATVVDVPAPPSASANCTEVPPVGAIVDDAGGLWTLNGTIVQLDGQQAGAGQGASILWAAGQISVWGSDAQWWRWTPPVWTPQGPTKPACTIVPPPPPPPLDPCVVAPVKLSAITWPSLAVGSRRLNYTVSGPAPLQTIALEAGPPVALTVTDTRGCRATARHP